MRVLLDTDVMLDVLANRQPFVIEASVIWLANEQGRRKGWVSPITPVNVFYILRKQRGATAARQIIGQLLEQVQVCSLDSSIVDAASALPMPDFEDAVQASAAAAARLDALVTRNTKDCRDAPLPVLTPAEVLARLASEQPPTMP